MNYFTNSRGAIYASRLFCLLLLCIVAVWSCQKEEKQPTPSPATNLITGNPTVTGISVTSVLLSGSVYTITVPTGTNVKALKMNIPVPNGAKIDPDPTVARDYTNPITYTITTADKAQQSISIKVVVEQAVKSSEKQITAFSFTTLSPVVQANIDQSTGKITTTVPANSDLTKLVPTITVSSKASVSPESGVAQNFTNLVSYTVTAENGSTQIYEVTVDRSANDFLLGIGQYGLNALNATSGTLRSSIANTGYLLSNSLLPVVQDGIIYTTGRDNSDSKALIGFDIPTGKIVWSTRISLSNNSGDIYSNLVVDNKIAYILTQPNGIRAIDISSGATKWINAGYADMSFTGSPTVQNGLVLTMGKKALYAFDANTGVKKWDFPLAETIFEKPLARDGIVYVADANFFYAVKVNSGELKWKKSIKAELSSPTLYNGIIYINGDSLYALDAETGNIKWTNNKYGPFVISEPYLVLSYVNNSFKDEITAFNLNTGAIAYSKEISVSGKNLLGADGSVFIGNGLKVVKLDAATGEIKWTYVPTSNLYNIFPLVYVKDGKTYYPVESGMQQ